jgi:hypothetical protein
MQTWFTHPVLRITLCAFWLLLALLPTRAHAAVTVSSFKAQAQAAKIELTWTTASEINNVGFNLLRSNAAAGTFTRINANLIPTQCLGCIAGSSYSYGDSSVALGQTYFYKLQSVDNRGGTQLFGPASAAVSAPTATATRSPTGTPSPTRVASSTPTATPVPGTPTLTRLATITPAQFAPAPTATPAQSTPTRAPVVTHVAIAVPSASPTVERQAARGQTVPTALPTPTILALAANLNPTVEPVADEEMPTDPSSDSTSDRDRMERWFRVAIIGLSGLLGLGALAFSVLGLYLLAHTSTRGAL